MEHRTLGEVRQRLAHIRSCITKELNKGFDKYDLEKMMRLQGRLDALKWFLFIEEDFPDDVTL